MANTENLNIEKGDVAVKGKKNKMKKEKVEKTYVEIKPTIDLKENDKKFMVVVEVPGLKRKNVKVQLNTNTLTIEGKKKQKSLKKGQDNITECVYGIFKRSITLPDTVSTKKVVGKVKNGIFVVAMDKKDYQKPVKVGVK
ncbi:MAG: Hsp20/alpha crystallin family protein [Spirochaetes bacterium]|nr:Hsp20/alpha crystallin family protein [Spirochaetota bacterium]